MKIWHFSETAYPYLPPASEYESVRVDLPNRYYDPKKGAELFDRFIEEWQVAEEGGLEIMLNEHHQTPTCVDPAGPLLLAALARVTKTARLLILGNPVANRRQPVRVAEEMAFADILSHGRVEVGFVRGVPYEISPANANPVYTNERQWEALDLILKAWTSHDGPFSHEGRFFHARRVNIWPRPYQEPHPPIWVSSTSPDGAARVGARGFIQATFLPDTRRQGRSSTAIAAAGGTRDAVPTCRSIGSPMPPSCLPPTAKRGPRRRPGTPVAHRHQQDPTAFLRIRPATPRSRPTHGAARRRLALSEGDERRRGHRAGNHVRRHAGSGAHNSTGSTIMSADSGIFWWLASRAFSATQKRFTASKCLRAKSSQASRALSRYGHLRPFREAVPA